MGAMILTGLIRLASLSSLGRLSTLGWNPALEPESLFLKQKVEKPTILPNHYKFGTLRRRYRLLQIHNEIELIDGLQIVFAN